MEFRELRYFLGVAKEKNITKAAELLNTTQPNLTRQMKNLEWEIGKPLFIRGKRQLLLTDAGQLLQKRAEEILGLYRRTEKELRSTPSDIEGEVAIGSAESYSKELRSTPSDIEGEVAIGSAESYSFKIISRAVKAMQEKHPRIRVLITSGDAPDTVGKLDKGLLDFAVLIESADLSAYDSLPLNRSDRWGVLVGKDDPLTERESVTKEDLLNRPLICSKQSLEERLVERFFQRPLSQLNIKAVYNLIYNAALLTEEGVGCALTLENLVHTGSASPLRFIPLEPQLLSPLYLVWKKFAVLSPAARAFLDELKPLTAEP